MKRIVLALAVMLFAVGVKADQLKDMVEATLLDHVVGMGVYGFQSNDQGPAKLALVDSVLLIGDYNGSSVLDIQLGFFGHANDVPDQAQVANWIIGGQIRVDPFIRDHLPVPAHWEFLRAIEHGPVAYYDLTNKEFLPGYGVGMSFDLDPNIGDK